MLKLYELKNLCLEMAELGAANYTKALSPAKDLISQHIAYKDFGETHVRYWVSRGLVKAVRSGQNPRSKVFYSRAELMTVEKAERRNILIHK